MGGDQIGLKLGVGVFGRMGIYIGHTGCYMGWLEWIRVQSMIMVCFCSVCNVLQMSEEIRLI